MNVDELRNFLWEIDSIKDFTYHRVVLSIGGQFFFTELMAHDELCWWLGRNLYKVCDQLHSIQGKNQLRFDWEIVAFGPMGLK